MSIVTICLLPILHTRALLSLEPICFASGGLVTGWTSEIPWLFSEPGSSSWGGSVTGWTSEITCPWLLLALISERDEATIGCGVGNDGTWAICSEGLGDADCELVCGSGVWLRGFTIKGCSDWLACARALAKACTFPNRCFGSFASAVITTCSTSRGIVGSFSLKGWGGT